MRYPLQTLLGDASIVKNKLLLTRVFPVLHKTNFFVEESRQVLINVRETIVPGK